MMVLFVIAICIGNDWLICLEMTIVGWLFPTSFFIANLLSINNEMIPFFLRQFDSWVKVGTGVMRAIYNAVY